MSRTSKQEERRHRCPKKRKKIIGKKTGRLPDKGPKIHVNALQDHKIYAFIPKIKSGKTLWPDIKATANPVKKRKNAMS